MGVGTIKFVTTHFKEILHPEKDNVLNFYIAVGIAVFMCLLFLAIALVLLYALCTLSSFISAVKNFCLSFVNFVKDYIYPEEVQDEHIAGLYSEEAEKIRMTALLEESKED